MRIPLLRLFTLIALVPFAAQAQSLQGSPSDFIGDEVGPVARGGEIELALDDGTGDTNVGNGGFIFIWGTLFDSSLGVFPSQLTKVHTAWEPANATVGETYDIYIFADDDMDGDPVNATLMYSQTGIAIQSADDTFEEVVLDTPVDFDVATDIVIMIVNSGVGVGDNTDFPAREDQTVSQMQSFAGFENGASIALPVSDLGSLSFFGLTDDFGVPGNYLVRGILDPVNVANEPGSELPRSVTLGESYPNPFVAGSTVPFTVDQTSEVRIAVYDVLGREVALLVDGSYPVGPHSATLDARALPSGTYIYRLEANGEVQMRTMTLVK